MCMPDKKQIMYAYVKKKYSENLCNYNAFGEPSEIVGGLNYGQFGYDKDKLWVFNECGGLFDVCYEPGNIIS